MLRESGDRNSSIWLIGDSSPERWREWLHEPLDSRHPARHNIWTPVLEGIQKQVFCNDGRRVDDSQLYVRNAVHNREDKPHHNAKDWGSKLLEETNDFGKLLEKYKPPLVFTFGAFAFEFARRSLTREPKEGFSYWNTKRLGDEFRCSIREFQPRRVNLFPLLHVSIARGQFLKSHNNFTGENNGNYFDVVAGEIGYVLLKHKNRLNVCVEPQSE